MAKELGFGAWPCRHSSRRRGRLLAPPFRAGDRTRFTKTACLVIIRAEFGSHLGNVGFNSGLDDWSLVMDKLLKLTVILLVSILIHTTANAKDEKQGLYSGEKLIYSADYPALAYFIKGDPNKPLVVFVPGDSHLARIAYGYAGGNKKDFLAHWINQLGYSFLAISYPLENPVFDKVYPEYNITDWGKQIAAISAETIKTNNLSKDVIVLGWSMGGKVAQSVHVAAKQNNINIDLFVALSADPPIPGLLPANIVSSIKPLPNGLADRENFYPWFLKAVEQQNELNHRVIIPKETYTTRFLGNISVNLVATEIRYHKNGWIKNIAETLKDSGGMIFNEYPFMAIIHGDSVQDAENVLFDEADWQPILMRKLYWYFLSKQQDRNLSSTQLVALGILLKNGAIQLAMTIHGSHFFFLGESGAKQTARAIDLLHHKNRSLKFQLDNLVIMENDQ